jgi:murein DD-endopeptidase MepM/ murein hydrolase activator NlpD
MSEKNMDKYYSFLYVKGDNAGMRSIRIHRVLAITLTVVFIAVVAVSISMIVKYSGVMMDSRELEELQRENEALASRLESFHLEVEDLKQRMEVNLELQNRARLLASLEPLSRDVWEVGVGGPEPTLTEIEMGGGDLGLMGLEEDLERMIRQSNLQLESYQEIIEILEEEKQIRDTTPSIRPLRGGYLSSRFGRRMDPFTGRISWHRGLDYRARLGTPVISTADGIVTMAKKKGSFGLVVEVNHGNGFKTRYAHLSKMLVGRGQRIKRGEAIGLVGSSGRSTGSHLHYEVIFRRKHRDPLQYIIPEDTYFD